MKVTSVKNVVLWALVVVNLVFVSVYLLGVYSDGVNKAQMLRDLTALMAKKGIAVAAEDIKEGGILPGYTTSRSEQTEQRLVDALLGHTTKIDEGGSIFDYYGEKGRATFTGGGEFRITLHPGAYPTGADAQTTAFGLLQTLKIETYSVSVLSGGSAGDEKVVAVCSVSRQPIFDCRVVMTFRDGSLAEINGKLATTIQPTGQSTDMNSAATALLMFLNDAGAARASKAILSVEPGYDLTETAVPGAGVLQPVWRVQADTGIFIVNTVTRKIEQSIE